MCFDLKKLKEPLSFALVRFSEENPALYYALLMMVGIWIRLQSFYLLFFLSLFMKNKVRSFIIILFSFLFTLNYYPNFPNISSKVDIEGLFKITNIIPTNSYNKKGRLYFGKLLKMRIADDHKFYKNLPITVFLNEKNSLDPSFIYNVKGSIKANNCSLSLKITESCPFKKHFTLVPQRERLKSKVRSWVENNIANKDASGFFSGLLLGYVDDKFLSFNFKRVGLQHLMAISGFHFGLIALFFTILLKRLLNFKILPIVLLIIINLYFLYIGNSPSILRAYTSQTVLLISMLLNKKNNPMNTLGLALIVEFILDPLNLKNVGFQLSFVSVLAIFLIYPQIERALSRYLIKRDKEELKSLKCCAMGAILINFIRESLSLTLAVNLAISPILLFYFHKLPLLSFFYNLFFPPLMLISLLLLFCCSLLPFKFLFSFTSYFTKTILAPILHPPVLLEYNIYLKIANVNLIALYLFLCFFIFLTISYLKKFKKESEFFKWL